MTGRVPFYGKSLKEIVKKNTEANINFAILKKENFSKSSKLKSYKSSEGNAWKKPKSKNQCQRGLESWMFLRYIFEKSIDNEKHESRFKILRKFSKQVG